LQNPFQDDDIQGLSLRVGAAREELAEALNGLSHERLLKPAGRHGYMLDSQGLEPDRAELAEATPATQGSKVTGTVAGLAHFQEELFTKLREELVDPLVLIQQFLEDPQSAGLGPARAALEQINWFLDDFMLSDKPAPATDQLDTGFAE